MEKRTKKVNVRLTEMEYNNIKKQGLRYSDIFYMGMHYYSKKEKQELKTELRRIGNNLNQIVKYCNTNKTALQLKELNEIKELLKNYANEIDKS